MQTLASMLPRFELPPAEVRAKADAKAREIEAAERRYAAERRIRQAGIPARYRGASMADACEPVRRWAADVAAGSTDSLMLKGPNGTGKTTQACAALMALAGSMRGEFATMTGILGEVKATYSGPGSERRAVARWRNVPLLVVDDLGKENVTPFALAMMYAVIDGRYQAMRPTVYTTNDDSASLFAKLSAGGDEATAKSIVSRLADARQVRIGGADRRLAR